ncbi:MAG: O-antigen ligase family protein [Planctomycetota bacterium]
MSVNHVDRPSPSPTGPTRVSMLLLFEIGLGLALAVVTMTLLALPMPYLAFGIIPPIAALLLFKIIRSPEYAYYLIIALIPLNAWRVITEQYPTVTISKLLGIFVVIVLFWRLIVNPEETIRYRLGIWRPLLLFVLVGLVSALFSAWRLESFDNLRMLVQSIVFMGLTIYFVREKELTTVVPFVIVLSAAFSAGFAIYGSLYHIPGLTLAVSQTGGGSMTRALGLSTDPNFFAAMILCSIPLLAYFFFNTRRRHVKAATLLLFVLNSYAIVLSYSRAVTLIFLATLLLIVFEYARKIRFLHLGFVILLLLPLGVVTAWKLPQSKMFARMMTLKNSRVDESLMRRRSYLTVAGQAFYAHPVLGSGPGTFLKVYSKSPYAAAYTPEAEGFYRVAHNTFLEVLVGTGLVGFAFFLILIFIALKYFYVAQKIFRKIPAGVPPECVRAFLYSFLSLLMSLLFLSDLYLKYLWLHLGIAAVVYHLARQAQKEGA